MTLQFKIRGQTLYKLTPGDVTEGTINYINCQFDFCTEDWEGCIKTALFQPPGGGEPYPAMLVEDACTVPWEALEHPGLVSVSVFGVRDDYKITSSVVQFRNRATLTGGAVAEPPTPTVYEQVLNELAETRQHATEQAQESKTAAGEAKGYAESAANTVDGFAAAAETASESVANEGASQVSNVQSAGQAAVQSVIAEGERQVETVGAAGADALQAVQDAAAEIVTDRGQIDTNKTNISNLQSEMRTKADAIVRTVSGESLLVKDSSGDGVRGLKVFGRSKQVHYSGKNLFNPENVLANTWLSTSDHMLHDNSRTTSIYIPCLPNIPYTISKNIGTRFIVGYTTSTPAINTEATGLIEHPSFASITITTGSDAAYIVAYVHKSDTDTISLEEMLASIQIELGDTATEYEPYTGGIPSPNPDYPQEIVSVGDGGSVTVSITDKAEDNVQTLALPTPNGLLGIPVTDASLANYIDADGQMWCADEVDFERGVYVQRIWKGSPVKPIVFIHREDTVRCSIFNQPFGVSFKSGAIPSMSTIARYSAWGNGDNGTFALAGSGIYYKDSTKTLEEVNAMFAELGTNFEVAGILAESIETPLTESELVAYRALHTNYPVTTILNDAGAWMQMQYNADTQLYIDNKIAEVLASLANTNAQLL